MKYRVGLSTEDVENDALKKANFVYSIVVPRKRIVESAKITLGKPYKRGASVLNDAPNAFDCSSLVAWAAVEAGFAIPRVTVDQFVFSKRISESDLLPGDLVFSNTKEIKSTEGSYYSKVLGREVKEEPIRYETLEYMPGTKVPEGVDHVGIYIGEGRVIHSTSKKGEVVEEYLAESPSFQNIVGYGRIIDDESKRFVIEIPDDRPDLRNAESLIEWIKYGKRDQTLS